MGKITTFKVKNSTRPLLSKSGMKKETYDDTIKRSIVFHLKKNKPPESSREEADYYAGESED
jgi:hypothetical protein